MVISEVPCGSQVLDWNVPAEWTIHDAFISNLKGDRLVDMAQSNLHVVGYSEPVDTIMTRAELERHLYSLPDLPEAIPYVTSYYQRHWGFCLSEIQRHNLGAGPFRVVINSDLFSGTMTYGEVVIPGKSSREVLFSTYVCHPSMANNELSGPVVTTALALLAQSMPVRRYTYRFVFAPETIGSITYISKHGPELKTAVDAGWVVTCVGDDRAYSYLPSRRGDTLADKVSLRAINDLGLRVDKYSFLDRGSDERQWCSPLLDLPVSSLMRSKYGTYPEYHTSLDNLDFVSPSGLQGAYTLYRRCVEILEESPRWRSTIVGEPQLGRRGLYPNVSKVGSAIDSKHILDVLTYCDGSNEEWEIAELVDLPTSVVQETCLLLLSHGLVE